MQEKNEHFFWAKQKFCAIMNPNTCLQTDAAGEGEGEGL